LKRYYRDYKNYKDYKVKDMIINSRIIVIGNEKGGCGKTTTAMHLIISLLKLGFKVGSIDLDSRQQSLSRYIDNRKITASKELDANLLIPEHIIINKNENKNSIDAEKEEVSSLIDALTKLADMDFILIDTPGSDTHVSRVAHSYADIVITPINDSFVDLDLIGQISAETLDSIRPGIYSAMLWEQKVKRASEKKKEMTWIVVRNRLSMLDAINRRNVEVALNKLSARFGFKVAPGFGDRVIFKELFLHGLTLHDASTLAKKIRLSPSVIAARQELRDFVNALGIPEINEKLKNAA
jgi:chromosome partitioning protein